MYKSRRSVIRLYSYTFAAFIVAVAFGMNNYYKNTAYERYISYTYQYALLDLSDNMRSIDTNLKKQAHISDASQIVLLSSEIYHTALNAKQCVGMIPYQSDPLDKTNKYLSQVGGYSVSLSDKASKGILPSDEDRENLRKFSNYAAELMLSLDEAAASMEKSDGSLSLISKYENRLPSVSELVSESMGSFENEFQNYPTLIYDGPFSENLSAKEPQMLKNTPALDYIRAFDGVAGALNLSSTLEYTGEAGGNIPFHSYTCDDLYISLTVNGGYLLNYMNSRRVMYGGLEPEKAISAASDFLANAGYVGMEPNHYIISNNILTINFAYTENGVTFYPDHIKIGVALDDGNIVSVDTRSYIISHKERSMTPVISSESAMRAIDASLDIQNVRLAVIPVYDKGELLCYEIKCVDEMNDTFLIYINTQNGGVDKILYLIDSPDGQLVI